MPQQILIINGGTTYPSTEEYISHLRSTNLNLDRLKPQLDWKTQLPANLDSNYEVFIPKMPNVTNARYEEWRIWFEKIFELVEPNVILIGHSLGGTFLAKYLSENTISKPIKATILIAAPYNDDGLNESLAEFNITRPITKLIEQGGVIYLIHSNDDPVVPTTQLKKFQELIPNARSVVLEGMGHFKVPSFPQIINILKNL